MMAMMGVGVCLHTHNKAAARTADLNIPVLRLRFGFSETVLEVSETGFGLSGTIWIERRHENPVPNARRWTSFPKDDARPRIKNGGFLCATGHGP
jgi:hypothetical protein